MLYIVHDVLIYLMMYIIKTIICIHTFGSFCVSLSMHTRVFTIHSLTESGYCYHVIHLSSAVVYNLSDSHN